ncbi:MAG: class I lanthipeptide [Candidatus Aminicenantes bacterium]|jgi:hypothetical protein
MRVKKFSKKLILNKKTIANFKRNEMRNLHAGNHELRTSPYTGCFICTDTCQLPLCNPE